MEIELEMYVDEDDESIVMKKVSEITRHAKELGFKIGELEFKNKEHRHKQENKHRDHS